MVITHRTGIKNPSKTALCRAVANKEYPERPVGADVMAAYFLPWGIRRLIQFRSMRARGHAKARKRTPGVYEYVMARTVFFDELFVEALSESIPQIVLLGAGYDSRAYRFSNANRATRIFELDAAATQERKWKCLRRAKVKIPREVSHRAVDFNRETLGQALASLDYEENKKTLFIWEGVCMYLEPQSVDATLSYIANTSHGESLVAFDYVISTSGSNRSNAYYGADVVTPKLRRLNPAESLKFTIEESDLESFLSKRGLSPVVLLDHMQIERRYLIDADGSSIGKPIGSFRLAVASPC